MTKVPFTPQGIESLRAQLYALPPSGLQQEIEAVKTDFALWVNNRIDLAATQSAWLQQIDPLIRHYWGAKMAIALQKQVVFGVKFPPASGPGSTGGAKWVMEKEPIEVVWTGPATFIAAGSFMIELGYS